MFASTPGDRDCKDIALFGCAGAAWKRHVVSSVLNRDVLEDATAWRTISPKGEKKHQLAPSFTNINDKKKVLFFDKK
jgi:hypothetical protein